jgi:hypothetical protein
MHFLEQTVQYSVSNVQETQEAMRAALRPEQLAEFSIVGRDADFEDRLGGKVPTSGVVSMKADVKGKAAAAAQLYKKVDKKGDKGRKHKGEARQKSSGHKKRKT